MLPKESILEFIKIYEKEEGIRLSMQEATAMANNLIGLFKRIYKHPVDRKVKE